MSKCCQGEYQPWKLSDGRGWGKCGEKKSEGREIKRDECWGFVPLREKDKRMELGRLTPVASRIRSKAQGLESGDLEEFPYECKAVFPRKNQVETPNSLLNLHSSFYAQKRIFSLYLSIANELV